MLIDTSSLVKINELTDPKHSPSLKCLREGLVSVRRQDEKSQFHHTSLITNDKKKKKKRFTKLFIYAQLEA